MSKLLLAASGALIVILVLTSCATKPVLESERRSVARDRIINSVLLAPSQERTAKFIITRDAGYTGSLTGIDVFLEGDRIARLATKESITIFATPGRHLVGARYSWGSSISPPAEREFVADRKKACRIRVTIDPSGDIDLKPESGLL